MSGSTASASGKVIIIGAGWAGLAAAVELVRHGIPVRIVEAAGRTGGRARSIEFADCWVDNGPHLLLGACDNVLKLLTRIGLRLDALFDRYPLELTIRSLQGPGIHLQAPRLPAPCHLLAALATATGLSLRDRRGILRLARALRRPDPPGDDMAVATLLQIHGQTPRAVSMLWEPLCVAALNTPVNRASARLFVQVLRATFTGRAKNSDLLVPRRPLASLLPEPAEHLLAEKGSELIKGRRATGIRIEGGRMKGIYVAGESPLAADDVIVATGPRACRDLIASHAALAKISERITALGSHPVSSVFLRYPDTVGLESNLVGIAGGTAQWAFDYGRSGQPGLIAAVISGPGTHMELDNDALAGRIGSELSQLYPTWPQPRTRLVIREKQATFASVAGVDACRPGHQTPVRGCWLAGDYTNTGLPGTLEGAVRSGLACAQAIISARRGQT